MSLADDWLANQLTIHQDAILAIEDLQSRLQAAVPTRLGLGFPRYTLKTTGEEVMATLAMLDTEVAHIPIQTLNAEGNVVPAPAGDVFAASSTDTTQFTAGTSADANGNAQIDVTPMVQTNSAGVAINLTDSNGLTAYSFTVTVSRDVKAASDFANLSAVTFTTQPEPTAPGPG